MSGIGLSCCCCEHPDRKNCENVLGKLEDLAYNAASFVWTPEVGAKVREEREEGGGGGGQYLERDRWSEEEITTVYLCTCVFSV